MRPFIQRWAIVLVIALPAPAFAQRFAPFGPTIGGFSAGHRSVVSTKIRIFPQYAGRSFGVGPIVPIVNVVPVAPFWPYYPAPFNFSPPVVFSGQPVEVVEPVPVPARRGPIMPGQPAGRFRPVGQAEREQARARPAPAAPPLPQENPLTEHDRLIREGKLAFLNGEYGRSGELFGSASRVLPEQADSFLLLVQVGIALGKYADAASAAHQGLRRAPGWPLNGPPLSDLYGGNLLAFAQHRRALEDAAATDPDDAALQFVRAYAMWFEGRRDEARMAFRALRPIVTDPAVIDLFLQQ